MEARWLTTTCSRTMLFHDRCTGPFARAVYPNGPEVLCKEVLDRRLDLADDGHGHTFSEPLALEFL